PAASPRRRGIAVALGLVVLAGGLAGSAIAAQAAPAATRPAGRDSAPRPGAPARPGATAVSGTQPNILFILTDDQRWDALGAAGNKSIRTPALDRLAAGGARLDAFFVASPLCSPSRASFLTGRYP